MSDHRPAAEIGPDDDIQRLLTLAGPRLQPPADVEARVRAATLAAVAALPEPAAGRRRWRKPALAAAAAVLLILITAVLIVPETRPPNAGAIVYASGAYSVRGAEAAGAEIAPGSMLRTSPGGRMLVDLGAGRSLRIDRDTSLILRDDSEIWLQRGRIYIDAAAGRSVTVITPYASVRDVGTLFEVQVSDDSLMVATREGAVDVRLGDRAIRSGARPGVGEALQIDGLTLTSRESIPTTGARWAWTQSARPPFAVQQRTYREYLQWCARESGKILRFTTPLAAQQAGLRTLGGTTGATAEADADAIARVLATSSVFEVIPAAAHEIVVGLREVD